MTTIPPQLSQQPRTSRPYSPQTPTVETSLIEKAFSALSDPATQPVDTNGRVNEIELRFKDASQHNDYVIEVINGGDPNVFDVAKPDSGDRVSVTRVNSALNTTTYWSSDGFPQQESIKKADRSFVITQIYDSSQTRTLIEQANLNGQALLLQEDHVSEPEATEETGPPSWVKELLLEPPDGPPPSFPTETVDQFMPDYQEPGYGRD